MGRTNAFSRPERLPRDAWHCSNVFVKLDLEGIVKKYKFGPYGPDGNVLSTWYKIRNCGWSHMVGRNELFRAGSAQKTGSWLAGVRTGLRKWSNLRLPPKYPFMAKRESYRDIAGCSGTQATLNVNHSR
jgi:hypothetical protein